MSTSIPGNLVSLPVLPIETAPKDADQNIMIGTFPQYYDPLPGVGPFRAVLLATVAGALLWVILFKLTQHFLHLL